ncbi:MAG TPA: hypothetical protein VGP80_01825 [Gemmatimonadales bacterium]|nr:hypothetical protein [Gemmatimonadales bacterium]
MIARAVAFALLVAGVQFPLQARQIPTDSISHDALRVFVDCNTDCDFDYFHEQIKFVDYVRDRQVAQVHVLITSRNTGSGGDEFTLKFVGLREFAGLDDELKYASQGTSTEDEIRGGVTSTLRLGLIRYVARMPLAKNLTIEFEAPTTRAQLAHDPWNYWVFRLRVNGFFSSESSTRERELSGAVSANRVTDASKASFSARANGSRSTFIFPVDTLGTLDTVIGRSSSYSLFGLYVRSLSAHWSAGASVSGESSENDNLDRFIKLGPALEFDIYPYSESTRRQFTLLYRVSYSHANYAETTIFGKREEGRFSNSLNVSVDATQPWGQVNVSAEAFAYLDDWSKNHLELFGGLELRVFRGLSMNLFASYTRVRDQLSLSAAGIDPNDILLRLRELKTSYRYHISLGLSYTFGSIHNNVVNPRFDVLD